MDQQKYAEIIDVLMNPSTDFKAIAVAIAKFNPDVFFEAIDDSTKGRREMDSALLSLLREKNKIGAIKLCRELTGFGLKEAKDYVDALDTRASKVVPPITDREVADLRGEATW